mmetsp:Transcript_19296/g.18990  ORF Transcript_19296/g.18990 Transcript_19296/m.18990 type:complete len:125 (+) Transcript_19296:322-696(+)
MSIKKFKKLLEIYEDTEPVQSFNSHRNCINLCLKTNRDFKAYFEFPKEITEDKLLEYYQTLNDVCKYMIPELVTSKLSELELQEHSEISQNIFKSLYTTDLKYAVYQKMGFPIIDEEGEEPMVI